jgi:(2S)-methylsuccinyl-CoA dehydrogenase
MGKLVEAAITSARETTQSGRRIDDHQVHAERLAYLSTQFLAGLALSSYCDALAEAGQPSDLVSAITTVYVAEITQRAASDAAIAPEDFGLTAARLDELFGGADARAAIRSGLEEQRTREIGRRIIQQRGVNSSWLPDEVASLTRQTVRSFAQNEVAPIAERVHRQDELVPDSLIRRIAEQGFFASSIPEEYGGTGLGSLAMVITTEELSIASLAAAGSLITRPEILAKAILRGGTDDQKAKWLPKLASGEVMVAIAVTEPDAGSDVAAVTCRAERATIDGREGFLINGAKAWSTFAGRAEVIALLARTDPDAASGSRGLSLFIVEKEPFYGHDFEQRQPHGGVLSGTAIPTLGYRGMHSYVLNLDNFFVPEANLVGGEEGLNRGFYLQMSGFAAGRLQTAGRALGVAQAALEKACEYVERRSQFGHPLKDYQLTEYKIGRMAVQIEAGRRLTYQAAQMMHESPDLVLEPAMAKLLTCDVAVAVTQEAQMLHGGWGYAEETAVSRYVVDALVLPIFEGVKPILELKVIARSLLA